VSLCSKGESLQQFVRCNRPEPQERRVKEIGSITQEIQSRAEKKNGKQKKVPDEMKRKRNMQERKQHKKQR